VSRVVALLVVFAATTARADRVLLADPDPELLHAVESSLSPWKLAVVVEREIPADDITAHARAEVTGARFVVWRENDQLVVFDRDRDASERRPARAGTFDAVTAAAAALTVKTMMRLPPPPLDDGGAIAAPVGPIADGDHVEVRIEAGAAARVPAGADEGLGGRALIAVMVRPSAAYHWRLGVRGDLGTSTSLDRSGFKGTWSDWAVLVAASWTYERGAWELEPWLGAGIGRGTLDGTEMAKSRTEHATLLTVRGGGYVRRRFAAFTAGLGVELVGSPTAPTYTRSTMGMGMPSVFEASKFSVVVGFALAVDLGR
jgi:hypothetical protein